ncbi:LysE family translocator [Nocardia huaxiensis]|uniref:LysE family translocator n=1 Tax=Nocardia huaxiensis TaxID=2755382 RepID=A0A7D6V7F5_9NOCA|nr:LysE family translocator [Nocardia huaxiensis]QLY28514.1 LysE family translocator [Nocardia huaxiensis]
MLEALLSFALVAGLLTIVPGVDTALVLRAAVSRGRRYAFATAFGIGSGTLVWGVAAAAGVSALLTASELAYTVLRVAGAVYLVWMGIAMIREARRPVSNPPEAGADSRDSVLAAWARGLGTNLLNPKVGVFYLAMLPQFLPQGVPPLLMGSVLALVHNIEGMLWFSVIITAATVAKTWLSRAAVRRALDTLTGTIVIGFGVKLATTQG